MRRCIPICQLSDTLTYHVYQLNLACNISGVIRPPLHYNNFGFTGLFLCLARNSCSSLVIISVVSKGFSIECPENVLSWHTVILQCKIAYTVIEDIYPQCPTLAYINGSLWGFWPLNTTGRILSGFLLCLYCAHEWVGIGRYTILSQIAMKNTHDKLIVATWVTRLSSLLTYSPILIEPDLKNTRIIIIIM